MSTTTVAASDSGSNPPPRKYVPPHLRNKQAENSISSSGSLVMDQSSSSSSQKKETDASTSYRHNHNSHNHTENSRWSSNSLGNGNEKREFPHDDVRERHHHPSHHPRSHGPMKTNSSWDTRDGRRVYREREETVFKSVKEHKTGINFDTYDNIPVEVSGNGFEAIKPIESFQSTSGVHELLMENVKRVNYNRPTPVQKHSIPIILEGRDLMACAQTGSGKTAAFLFPIITGMLRTGPPQTAPSLPKYAARSPPSCPVGLVLSPTRELAIQIFEEARKFTFSTGIRTVVLYGGNEIKLQLTELERGCDICVATPGRLCDFSERRKIRLCHVHYLVLDEADRMLDMGFSPQIKMIVDGTDMPSSYEGRQTVMFSATFPKEIQQLAKDYLQNYIFLAVGRVGSTNAFITQRVMYADEDQKLHVLRRELNTQSHDGLTLIFVETKRGADKLEDAILADFHCVCIHGDRSQQEREEALRLFASGSRPILVATDVAARGLDIQNITHVINYDLPTNVDDYVHRIGRTGRAGNLGVATSFVNEKNRPVLKDLLGILAESRQSIPEWFKKMVSTGASSRNDHRPSNRYGGGFGGRDARENNAKQRYNDAEASSHSQRKTRGNDRQVQDTECIGFRADAW